MPGRPQPVAALEGPERLEALRVRGHQGGVIAPHRAMVGLRWTAWRLVSTVLLVAGGLAGYFASLPWIGLAWQRGFRLGRGFLGLPLPLGTRTLPLPGGLELTLPAVAAPTPLPDGRVLWIAGIGCAAVVLLSFLFTERFTPLKYFLRLLVLIQLTAIAFFALAPGGFPYRVEDHVFLLLTAGLLVLTAHLGAP